MSEFRIPTLLGLGVLFIGLVIGVLLVIQRQGLSTRASTSAAPKEVMVSNITDNSATISWFTEVPVPGFIQAGPESGLGLTFNDERDPNGPRDHQLHYVTIKNIPPQSTFYYQITSGTLTHPEDQPLTVTTASDSQNLNTPPIIGTVSDVNNQPVQEALIILSINGAQKLTTITKTAGSFILPLAYLRTEDLTEPFVVNKTPAELTIQSGDKRSIVKVTLPHLSPYPPITLGKDLDYSKVPEASGSASVLRYDVNGDNTLNAADHAFVQSNLGKNKDKRADLNKDGTVDQKDLDLIFKEIERNSR